MSAPSNNLIQVVDPKWRLLLPVKYRPMLTPQCVVFVDEDDFLALVPPHHWTAMLEHMGRQRSANPDNDALASAIDRTLNFSERVSVDDSARFVLPARLRSECDLAPETKAVFLGRNDRVTLISQEVFERDFEPKLRSDEAKAEQKRLLRGVTPLLELHG